MGISIGVGTDLAVLARDLSESHDAVLSGSKPAVAPSPEVAESWTRALSAGAQPSVDAHGPDVITGEELSHRRATHPIRDAVDRIRVLFSDSVDDASLALAILDADGVLLWRGGSSGLMPVADRLGLVEGSRWDEDSVATTAVGLAIRHDRPIRVFGAEHYSRALHGLFCTAAPIHDRRTGKVAAIAGLAGPALTMQPAADAFTTAIAALGQHEVTAAHLGALAELRAAGAAQLAALHGPGLLVDDDGWVAEGRGCPLPSRVAAPVEGMRQFVPGLGLCVVEQLNKGWLVRRNGPSAPVLAELDLRGEPSITVSGNESWRTVLTPRHAQILLLLADAGPSGLNSQQVSHLLFGDGDHTVTVRAELSRLRRVVGELVSSRPYRLTRGVELQVVGQDGFTDPDGGPESPDTPRDGMQRFPA